MSGAEGFFFFLTLPLQLSLGWFLILRFTARAHYCFQTPLSSIWPLLGQNRSRRKLQREDAAAAVHWQEAGQRAISTFLLFLFFREYLTRRREGIVRIPYFSHARGQRSTSQT